MAEEVENSLRYLKPDDIRAIIIYLRGVPAPVGWPACAAGQLSTGADLGPRVFVQACVGCHLPDGTGRQSPWAALRGSHTAGDPAGANLMQVLAGHRDRDCRGADVHAFVPRRLHRRRTGLGG